MRLLLGSFVCSVLVARAVALPSPTHTAQLNHYEYVFPDNGIDVYNIDHRGAFVGSDRRSGGSMLKYNLMTDHVVWAKQYPFGVDSMSVSPDGKTIYVPTGELAYGGIWKVIDANSGNFTASIDSGGRGPHNTVVSPDGARVYIGPRHSNYLVVANTGTNQVIRKIGPVGGAGGVRPFTINGAQSLAFITLSRFLGFQVGDISTEKILYTVPVQRFPTIGRLVSAPSHGISLSPDEKRSI